jgi:hypothetical protein
MRRPLLALIILILILLVGYAIRAASDDGDHGDTPNPTRSGPVSGSHVTGQLRLDR